jgi:hypothetical protein
VAYRALVTTGMRYEFRGSRPELLVPARPGEHVWIAAAAYVLAAERIRGRLTDHVLLDSENLAELTIGCYVCEQPWSERLSYRRCPGEPPGEV